MKILLIDYKIGDFIFVFIDNVYIKEGSSMKKMITNNYDVIGVFIKKIFKLFHINISDNLLELLIQIFKFVMVGCISTCIDFIFLYIFRDICKLSLILSNTLSFCISVIYNYWASMTFVFNVKSDKNSNKIFIIFVLFSVIGLLLNNIIVWCVTNLFNVYYMLSKIVATIFVMIFNFVTRKKFIE